MQNVQKWEIMEVITNVREDEWKKFLDVCDTATIYHTPEWKKLIESTFNYEPYYLFIRNDSGKIAGLLPMFHVKSIISGDGLCCVPFAHECGPIGDAYTLNILIEKGIDLYRNMEIGPDRHHFNMHIEVKDSLSTDFHLHNIFSMYILELSNVQTTWNIIHKSMRRYVKKSLDKVEISRSSCIKDAELFYQVNCINKKDKGIMSHPKDFFCNLVCIMPENVDIYLAKLNNKIIGGIINISFKDKVFYGFGATDPRYIDYHPLHGCIWKSIEDACLNGYKIYDFGIASCHDTGMTNFKKRWGTIEKKLYYSYYPILVGKEYSTRCYQVTTKIIQYMPMCVYKKFSDIFWMNNLTRSW
jgi:hypothetical protein